MRISRTVVAERETWLKDFFKENPEATAEKANKALKEKTGHAMRATRVYELRKSVKGEAAPAAAPEAPAAPAETPAA